MASLLKGLVFDAVYGSRILSLLLCTLDAMLCVCKHMLSLTDQIINSVVSIFITSDPRSRGG